MANLKLFAFIFGDPPPSMHMFPIITLDSIYVGELKELVYTKAQDRLKGVGAIDLTLWKLHTPIPTEAADNMVPTRAQDLPALALKMLPGKLLSSYFTLPLVARSIHVVVQIPESAPPPQQLPGSDEGVIQEKIAKIQPGLESAINTFLEENIQLPLWEPTACSDEVRRHIVGLKIPKISTASQIPSLLLHNLGIHNAQLAKRVKRLFAPDHNQKFLCNTSGSGKTRLLFEGLWRHWGLYFTARTQPEGLGSSDLEKSLQLLAELGRLSRLPSENLETTLTANRGVTFRHLLRVLYARTLIFRVFLECASAMPDGITEQHKSRWLLMQLAPKTLLETEVFETLNDVLRLASFDYLSGWIRLEQARIAELLGPRKSTVFCILDEAQVPANEFLDYFLSDTKPTARRPILREIMCAWTPMFPNLIVSGTGMSMQEVETDLGSMVAKEHGQKPETITDLGAFDDEENQRAYLASYLPPGYLSTKDGKVVASRVRYWLHGRHRFTATYASLLMQAGLETPHTVLNELVQVMTHFRPSDHPDDGTLSVPLQNPSVFDFSKLWKDDTLLRQIAGCIFDYIFNGKPRDLYSPADQKLVEYGVARFVVNRDTQADEPLALLAATYYFSTDTKWGWSYFLVDALSTSNAAARGIAFEQVGAYLLGLAFSSPRRLSEVFDFVGDNDLKDEEAQLVAIHQLDGKFICNPVNILSAVPTPTYIMGYSPRTAEETLAWIKDPQQTVFCFPASSVGPDLILVLMLSNKTVLRVVIQFGTEKSASKSHVANLDMSQDFRDALGALGRGTGNGGRLSVLRVLIPHLATPVADTLAHLAESDPSDHLVATVDLPLLADISQTDILESLKVRMTTVTNNGLQRDSNAKRGSDSTLY